MFGAGEFHERLSFGDEAGLLLREVVLFASIVFEVVELDGFLRAIADSFPVSEAHSLKRRAFVKLPVKMIA